MDGLRQRIPARILVPLLAASLLVGRTLAAQSGPTEDQAQAQVALAHASAAAAELARDLHCPDVAHPLAEAGLTLLELAQQSNDCDPRAPAPHLEARLRVVRAQTQTVSGSAIDANADRRAHAHRDFLAALELAQPLLESRPTDRALLRVIAAAELGLAQDETDAQQTVARCRSAIETLLGPSEGTAPVDADWGTPLDAWLLASAFQLLGETQAQTLADPQAALESFSRARPRWHRLQRLHPLGAAKLARCHLGIAGAHLSLGHAPQARQHLHTALLLTPESPRDVESTLIRARILTLLAALPGDPTSQENGPASRLEQAAALYRQLPSAVCPPLEQAALWRRQAELYLYDNQVEPGRRLLEQAIDRLESYGPQNLAPQALHRRNVELALGYLALGQLSEPEQPDEAHRRFAAAVELFATPIAQEQVSLTDAAAIDAARMGLICRTRLAKHLARVGELQQAVAQLQRTTEPFVGAVVPAEAGTNHDRADAPPDLLAGVTNELLLPLARALHLSAKIESELAPQGATDRYNTAVACYEAALREGPGDWSDLAVCRLDLAAVLAHRGEAAAARDSLQDAVALLCDVADRDPLAWLPLSTAYAELADLDLGQSDGMADAYVDRAVDAAREAAARDQPAARQQLAALLLQRGLETLQNQADESAARQDLEQAVLEFRRLRSERPDTLSDEDDDLAGPHLMAMRTLAKLLWISGEEPETVVRRWQEARELLEAVRDESGTWYAEAARLESLRAELIAWSWTRGESSGLPLVPTIEALPLPAPAAAKQTPVDDARRSAPVPSPAAVAQAYEIADSHYATAERLGADVADEWDVLLFNAADYCENFLGDARQALRFFEKELALQDRLSGSGTLRDANRALIGARMGLIESRLLARPDRAAEEYRQAVRHLESVRFKADEPAAESEVVVQAELSLGLLGAQLPEFQQAAEGHFAAALELLGRVETPTERILSFEYWAHHGLARQLRRAGDDAGAQQHIDRAAELAAQLGFDEAEVATGGRSGVE